MRIANFEKSPGGVLMPDHEIKAAGVYVIEHIRKGEVLSREVFKNLVTAEGLNSLLDVYLRAQSQLTAWYLGVFEGNYTPVDADTGATITGNSTESSAYTNATRPQWTPAAASGKAITNAASRATFTFNATKTIYGAFLISNSTIGGTSGVCFSAARFTTAKAVVNLDQLLLTYTFAASSV